MNIKHWKLVTGSIIYFTILIIFSIWLSQLGPSLTGQVQPSGYDGFPQSKFVVDTNPSCLADCHHYDGGIARANFLINFGIGIVAFLLFMVIRRTALRRKLTVARPNA